MPSTIVQKNYSKCPLKKRPINYDLEAFTPKDEPENLCVKKEAVVINGYESAPQRVATATPPPVIVMPTPQYPPKYGLQPWNFHSSPYIAEFYRTINNPHQHQYQQISPLRGELISPSSSEGSISPPPHYLGGRPNSVSPPIRTEIYRPIGVHQSQHRFMPYQLPATYQPYGLPLMPHHPAPISPAYSESSFYSMRSASPDCESAASSCPEDLSIKLKSCHSATLPNAANSDVSKDGKASSPPRYQCPDCNKSYSTFSGLTKHQQFHCPAAEGNQVKKSFSCKDCDKTYFSLGALKMHIRTHTLPCKCTICGKAFSRPWLLQGHIRTHTGEKPFSCQHCHRAFADRSNLRAHLQTHSDIKKYSCTSCAKTFSRMSLLTKHSEGGCPAAGGHMAFGEQ